MIRFRDKNGAILPVADVAFVEVCSSDGKVARVLFVDGGGAVHLLGPSDREFATYVATMRIEPAEIIKLEQ